MRTRRFIPYQTNIAIASASRQAIPPNTIKCQRCNGPVASNHRVLCDLCWSMLEAVATSYWVRLQHDWQAENHVRIINKRILLDPNYGVNDDPYPQEA